MGPDIFDLVIVITLALFTIRGATDGFVGEVAGIFALIAGFWAARAWNAQLAPYLTFIGNPSWRIAAACAILFLVAMIAIGFLARILKKIMAFSFAAWIDRFAGAILGLVKGVLLWALVIVLLEKLFQDAQFLRESRALPYFDAIIDQFRQWLPPDLANKI